MELDNFEEEKPKVPTNLLVFVIVSALVIALSIYYISKSGKARPLTTEELVEGDTLSTEESAMSNDGEEGMQDEASEELASSESSKDTQSSDEAEELSDEDAHIVQSVKKSHKIQEKKSDTPVKTVSQEKSSSNTNTKTTKTTERKTDTKGVIHVHTVRKNEFLSTIAANYNYPTSKIKELNGLDSDELKPGQKLKIKIQSIHKVKSNEQLSSICKKYSVSVTDVCKINNITKNKPLKIGQKLIIPLKNSK